MRSVKYIVNMKQTQQEWLQAKVSHEEPISGYLMRRLIAPELSAACEIDGERFDDTTYPMANMNREQLCGLMSVMSPENALAVICGKRIIDQEKAIAFLEQHGLESLFEDNRSRVDEAISRQADLSRFISIIAKERVALWRYGMECSWADLAEVYSTSLYETDVDYRLSDGDNTWAYVRSIGISNTYNYGGELLGLEGVFTPREVKKIVARSSLSMKNPAESYPLKSTRRERLAALVSISKELGVAATVDLSVPGVFNILKSALGRKPEADACVFIDEFIRIACVDDLDSRKWNYGSAHAYYEKGFNAEEALTLIKQDITPSRAAAVRDELVIPSISSGWL